MGNEYEKVPFAYKAAKSSWACILVIYLLTLLKRFLGGGIVDILTLLLMISGLVLGIIALFGIPRFGRKRILIPALIGIILNGFFILIFVTNFVEARNRAIQARASRDLQF